MTHVAEILLPREIRKTDVSLVVLTIFLYMHTGKKRSRRVKDSRGFQALLPQELDKEYEPWSDRWPWKRFGNGRLEWCDRNERRWFNCSQCRFMREHRDAVTLHLEASCLQVLPPSLSLCCRPPSFFFYCHPPSLSLGCRPPCLSLCFLPPCLSLCCRLPCLCLCDRPSCLFIAAAALEPCSI